MYVCMHVGDNYGAKRFEEILFRGSHNFEPSATRPYIHAAVHRPIHVHLRGMVDVLHTYIHTYIVKTPSYITICNEGVELPGAVADVRSWWLRFDPADEHHHHQQTQRRLGDAHQGTMYVCMYVCMYV